MNRDPESRGRQRGFSLLEVLVAFSIMSISLGVLLHIFSNGTRMAVLADEYTRAVQVAESVLATAANETGLVEGESYGTIEDSYRWRVVISPYVPVAEDVDLEALPVMPLRVKVSVRWGEVRPGYAVELTTLRLVPRE